MNRRVKGLIRCLLAFAGWHVSAVRLLGLPVCEAQTFAQLADMGSNIGPRLTRNVARNKISRDLFGSIGTKVTFIEGGVAYQFATDPTWARIVIGKKDDWLERFKNSSGPGGKLRAPYGIDISARKNVYIADWLSRRVLVATFSTSSHNLVSPRNLAFSGFGRPIDVAWDGGSTPLSTDYLYVLDDSLARIVPVQRECDSWGGGLIHIRERREAFG